MLKLVFAHVVDSYICIAGDPVDPIQSRCDPCYAQPCHNGGLCISNIKMISSTTNEISLSHSEQQFVCECSSRYQGDTCQVTIIFSYIISDIITLEHG